MCIKQIGTELGNPWLSALPTLSMHGLLTQPVISPKWRCWQPGFVEQIAARIGGPSILQWHMTAVADLSKARPHNRNHRPCSKLTPEGSLGCLERNMRCRVRFPF